MTDELVERVAQAIAEAMGDNFPDAFENKQRWTAKRGMSWGRFRDVNEPFKSDYLEAARAIIPIVQAEQRERDCLPVWFTQLVLTAAKYGNGIKIDAEQVNWLATAIRKGADQ